MALKLPPLSGLRLFEAAARCGSFKQAAHELNLTPGAVSHGIDSLEHWLDVELFERKAHGVVLSAAGRQFLPYVSEALATIATGTLRLPSRRFEERLAISSFSLFAYKVLLPRLHKFQALYPKITVPPSLFFVLSFFPFVMPGLDPGIHATVKHAKRLPPSVCLFEVRMDHRIKSGGDDF